MYCGDVVDVIQPLLAIGMNKPKSTMCRPSSLRVDADWQAAWCGRQAGVSA
jgi:hypothetical protein